mmetsp:Transcript_4134/g.15176  ORF Transcript_4134/g.15176 Transcript_4134/m.15176 type:complete len:205 (-) Transcript_4134:556-1170(-)
MSACAPAAFFNHPNPPPRPPPGFGFSFGKGTCPPLLVLARGSVVSAFCFGLGTCPPLLVFARGSVVCAFRVTRSEALGRAEVSTISQAPTSISPFLCCCRFIAAANRSRRARSAEDETRSDVPAAFSSSSSFSSSFSSFSSPSRLTWRTSSSSIGTRHTGHMCVGGGGNLHAAAACAPRSAAAATAARAFQRHHFTKQFSWKQW